MEYFGYLGAQEVFDIAAKFILQQGRPSIRNNSTCVYNMTLPNNEVIHCAAYPVFEELGVPEDILNQLDEFYEGAAQSVYERLLDDEFQLKLLQIDKTLLSLIQRCHDVAASKYLDDDSSKQEKEDFSIFIEEYIHCMKALATLFDLKTDQLYQRS